MPIRPAAVRTENGAVGGEHGAMTIVLRLPLIPMMGTAGRPKSIASCKLASTKPVFIISRFTTLPSVSRSYRVPLLRHVHELVYIGDDYFVVFQSVIAYCGMAELNWIVLKVHEDFALITNDDHCARSISYC